MTYILSGSTNITQIDTKDLSQGDYEISSKTMPGKDNVTLNDGLLQYIMPRLDSDQSLLLSRRRRYASIDRVISAQQTLSPTDSKRLEKEESTGTPQGIAATYPIADMYVEETTAFLTEVFAPASGDFYSNQGTAEELGQSKKLGDLMEADAKKGGYYAEVAGGMRSLLKYNFGGFWVEWQDGDKDQVAYDALDGNLFRKIDPYNFSYDPSILDVAKIRTKGEWVAEFEVVNQLALYREADSGELFEIERVFEANANQTEFGTVANYYRYPPTVARVNENGTDNKTRQGMDGGNGVLTGEDIDWGAFGASLPADSKLRIAGYERIIVYIWLKPSQFFDEAEDNNKMTLYKVTIIDRNFICGLKEVKDAVELPVYTAFCRGDEMMQAQRSYAEALKSFQRHISFMGNIAVAIERGNTYGLKAIDPDMFNKEDFKSGETSGLLVSKTPGRDVRAGIMKLDIATDTTQQYAAITAMFGMLEKMFPNQGLPSQVAGIDRAVQSQVAAVLVGAVRRLHLMVRRLDALIMNPARIASYRNYATYSDEARNFSQLTEKAVARLLNSGLGQLNREVAAAAVERILFTLIQNPNSAAQFDLPGLFKYWSLLLNTGVDLSQFVAPTGGPGLQGAVEPTDPNKQVQSTQPNAGAQGGGLQVVQ